MEFFSFMGLVHEIKQKNKYYNLISLTTLIPNKEMLYIYKDVLFFRFLQNFSVYDLKNFVDKKQCRGIVEQIK